MCVYTACCADLQSQFHEHVSTGLTSSSPGSIIRDIIHYPIHHLPSIKRVSAEFSLRAALLGICAIAHYLPRVTKQSLLMDAIGGITLGIILIPQGMSYALLANLPPIYGLYSCLMPPFMYMLFGKCAVISLGPFAIISLLVGSSVQNVQTQLPLSFATNTTAAAISTATFNQTVRVAQTVQSVCMLEGVLH